MMKTFATVLAVSVLSASIALGQTDVSDVIPADNRDSYCEDTGSFLCPTGTGVTGENGYLGYEGTCCEQLHNGYSWELDIPDGATITAATMTLECSGGSLGSGVIDLVILGEDSVDPGVWATSAGESPDSVSPETTATDTWALTITDCDGNGELVESDDFSAVLQEIVDNANWTSPPHFFRIIVRSGDTEDEYTGINHFSNATNDPLIEVTYTTGGGSPIRRVWIAAGPGWQREVCLDGCEGFVPNGFDRRRDLDRFIVAW